MRILNFGHITFSFVDCLHVSIIMNLRYFSSIIITDLSLFVLDDVRASRHVDEVRVVSERAGEDCLEVEYVREIGKEIGNATANGNLSIIHVNEAAKCFLSTETN